MTSQPPATLGQVVADLAGQVVDQGESAGVFGHDGGTERLMVRRGQGGVFVDQGEGVAPGQAAVVFLFKNLIGNIIQMRNNSLNF